MKTFVLLVTATVVVAAVMACKSGSGGSGGSPSAPTADGGGLPGTWSGTLSRPNGQALTVRWQIGSASGDGANTGPITLTNGSTSITVPARAASSGSDSIGYDLHVSINSSPGEVAGMPSCVVRASPTGGAVRFTAPYRTISIPLQVFYTGCETFIPPPPLTNFLQETGTLNLTKQ